MLFPRVNARECRQASDYVGKTKRQSTYAPPEHRLSRQSQGILSTSSEIDNRVFRHARRV